MVYYEGEYHLFYQRNPFGWAWGNMTWGHAVSKDMLHWKSLSDALHPDAMGTMFSGTGLVDKNNSGGFKTGDEDPILLFYTSAGGTNPWSKGVPFTQSLAYSNDRGRTWTKYEGNPIVEHIRGGNRDPKVFATITLVSRQKPTVLLHLNQNRYLSKDGGKLNKEAIWEAKKPAIAFSSSRRNRWRIDKVPWKALTLELS